MRKKSSALWVAAFLLAFAVPCGGDAAAPAVGAEHWYRVELAGAPAGWMVARETRRNGELISESSTSVTVKRGGVSVSMKLESRFVETAEGEPVRAWARQHLGAVPIETTYLFQPDRVVVRTKQGERTSEETVPRPGSDWLTPGQVDAMTRAVLTEKKESFSFATIDPLLGLEPVTLSWRRAAPQEPIDVAGQTIATSRWLQKQSYTPGVDTVVNLAADGLMVRSTTPLMGMAMTTVLVDRATALEAHGAPELLVQSFVYPDKPITRPRAVQRAVYALRLPDGVLPEIPNTGAQAVRAEAGRVVVTVALGTSPEVPATTIDTAPYLRTSTFVDHRDPQIRALLPAALTGSGERQAEKAEALRTFVASHLREKDLNSLLASASEVAVSRSGDCTEHSVLLAALLRAAEIPARVVSGLIYVEQFAGASDVFGYHMWTQAFVEGRWLDLDATVPSRFDAAHIAFTTTDLNDDKAALREMASIVPMMGKLEIEILATEHENGKGADEG